MKRQLRTHIGCKIIEALRNNPDVLNRMLRRIETSLRLFPTKTHGIGRFIFGGNVELTLQLALQELNFQVVDISHLNRVDLGIGFVADDLIPFSIKGISSATSGIILKNFHGNKTETVEPLPPTIIIQIDCESRVAHTVFITQSIVDSIPYTGGKRSKSCEKIKVSDSNVTLQRPFLAHLVNILDSDFCLTVPLPTNVPNCSPMKANEFILRYVVDPTIQEYDAQQTLPHSHSPSSPVVCTPPCLTDEAYVNPENSEDVHIPVVSDTVPCPPQLMSEQSLPVSETSLHSSHESPTDVVG